MNRGQDDLISLRLKPEDRLLRSWWEKIPPGARERVLKEILLEYLQRESRDSQDNNGLEEQDLQLLEEIRDKVSQLEQNIKGKGQKKKEKNDISFEPSQREQYRQGEESIESLEDKLDHVIRGFE